MDNSESAYCCMYCSPKITLYFSTDKYDGICQNCIGLLAIQAVFKSKSYKHSFSLFKDGYFKQDRMVIELDRKGEAIDRYYDYLHNGIVEWDTWIGKDDLIQELLSRAKQWFQIVIAIAIHSLIGGASALETHRCDVVISASTIDNCHIK